MVEIEVRIQLDNIRDLRGCTNGGENYGLLSGYTGWIPAALSVSIPEADARKLWSELGRHLRNVEKDIGREQILAALEESRNNVRLVESVGSCGKTLAIAHIARS